MSKRIGLLALLAVIAAVAALLSTGLLHAPQKKLAEAGGTGARPAPPRAPPAVPGPLHGVPLAGSTGLRLLVSADPPFLLKVDTGAVRPVTGLNVNGNPVLTVLPVGQAAVVWLDRPGEDTFQVTGTIIDIRTEVADTVPPVRHIAAIRLSDGTTVQCDSIAASSTGDSVIVNGSKSRLLGRRSIRC